MTRDWAALALLGPRQPAPGPAPEVTAPCVLCDGWHPRCKFTAGSLYCQVEGCPNPHHRAAS